MLSKILKYINILLLGTILFLIVLIYISNPANKQDMEVYIRNEENNYKVHAPNYQEIDAKEEIISQLIEFNIIGDYDLEDVEGIINRITRIPIHLLQELKNNKIRIILTNQKVIDIPEYNKLQGVVPRGWETTGMTWENVPGIGGNPIVIKIGYSYCNKTHGSLNLELHEIAHAIDTFIFRGISSKNEFINIHELEYTQLFKENCNLCYYEFIDEYFAEAFVYYFYSLSTREKLKDNAPLTYEFFRKIETAEFLKINHINSSKPLRSL
ncbi:anthrax toxin lethal factor-related metalloendopeptidase [Alkaliphilus peptidifermentans]|uniref:ATLF-like domain-containing protein n=1 Tax=Alkaliphilus peptidifermentans DSM 18978 TaxID=1120976 RepID=A0A1G5LD48_9FIRM|nr:hypothetical protein [Alkaliphilus peptidifermentans]SCZ10170.1 hypothetical protein SAMN03080606_04266 [Alkaliphilus peptidifermentans DSM 18978]